LSDFEAFAEALGADPIAEHLRVIATPASREIATHLHRSGLYARLFQAGVVFNPPGCGPCMGLHQGVLADGETCLATGSRNGAGRMGAKSARVFIASPAIAGRAAARGRIQPDLFDH
jgi:homoaconitase/3-isopropylmalate dehydratase large subunit